MIVLILTRMHFLREMLQQTLSVAGIPVATDGPEEHRRTDAFDGAMPETIPSLVLVDSSHPEGFAELAAIRARLGNIMAVVLAVTNRDEDFLAWADIGISGYLEPNTSTDQLIATVRRAAAGEVVCPPRLTSLLLKRFTSQSQSRSLRGGIHDLTARERQVLECLADGLCNKRIARRLHIAESTVKNHVHSILEKCDVRSRGEAAAAYRRSNPEPAASFRDVAAISRLVTPPSNSAGLQARPNGFGGNAVGQHR